MRAAIKQQIEQNFSRFASRYEGCAEQQKIAARALLARVEAIDASLAEGPVLEIGCGTGLLSESLVRMFPEREVQLTDLSPAMLAECQKKIAAADGVHPGLAWSVLDGETVAAEDDYALIVSGFTLQWFQDLEGTLERLVRALRCGGRLLASYHILRVLGQDEVLLSEARRKLRYQVSRADPGAGTLTMTSPPTSLQPAQPLQVFHEGAAHLFMVAGVEDVTVRVTAPDGAAPELGALQGAVTPGFAYAYETVPAGCQYEVTTLTCWAQPTSDPAR